MSSAHVVAHLGSHEPLRWQPVPAPTGVEDLADAEQIASESALAVLQTPSPPPQS
jgi:hypothetical protein